MIYWSVQNIVNIETNERIGYYYHTYTDIVFDIQNSQFTKESLVESLEDGIGGNA